MNTAPIAATRPMTARGLSPGLTRPQIRAASDRQQQLDRLSVGAAVERHEPLDGRNADIAIETGGFDAVGCRRGHPRQTALDQRFPAGAQLVHRRMDIGKDEAFAIGMAFP